MGLADQLVKESEAIVKAKDLKAATKALDNVGHIMDQMRGCEKHYLREENVLFPALDRHGIKEPPAIMWMEHDQIRAIMKGLCRVYEERANIPFKELKASMAQGAGVMQATLQGHFLTEDDILFKTAAKAIPECDWPEISHQFDEIGYFCSKQKSEARP